MKKSLTILLALSLVFSVFASLALAEEAETTAETTAVELTIQEKYDALKAQGIFEGHADGTDGVDENLLRSQVAVIVHKLLQLDISNAPAEASFTDVPASHWAYAYVEAALAAGILSGHGDGTFEPSGNITLQQVAVVLGQIAESLGVTIPDVDAAEGTTVAPWAAKYVAFATSQGFLGGVTDFTADATRGQLAEAIFDAQAILLPTTVASATVISSTEVEVTLTTGEQLTVELAERLVANVATEISFTHEGQEYTTTVTWVVDQGIVSFEAVGAKKLQVELAEDAEDADITVTRGSNNAPVSVEKIEIDGNVATITTLTVLAPSATTTYHVTVEANDAEFTASTDVEVEKITNIEIVGDTAALGRTVAGNVDASEIQVAIEITNQYGEDKNDKWSEVSQHSYASKGGSLSGLALTDGKLTISSPTVDYILNEPVVITLNHPQSQIHVSKQLTVSAPARVASVEVVGLYNADDKELNDSSFATLSDFAIEFKAVDQYGTAITNVSYIQNDIHINLPTILGAAVDTNNSGIQVLTGSRIGVELEAASGSTDLRAGTVPVTFMSLANGTSTTYDLVIAETSKVASFQISAPDFAVAGEEKILIPFTAIDQEGNELQNNASNLNVIRDSFGTPALNVGVGSINFVADHVGNKVDLVWDAKTGVTPVTNATPVFISGTYGHDTMQIQYVSLQVTLLPNAKIDAIAGVKDVKGALVENATTDLLYKNINVVDQHGRQLTYDKFSGYTVEVSTSSAHADIVGLSDIAGGKEIAGKDKAGTARVNITIKEGSTEVATHALNVQVVANSAIVDYDVAAIPTLYAGGSSAHAKKVAISGKLANGTLVALPANLDPTNNAYYSVAADVYGNVTIADADTGITVNSAAGDNKTGKITVTGYVSTGTVAIEREYTVSKADPVAAKLELKTSAPYTKESDALVTGSFGDLNAPALTIAQAVIKVTDQYGVEITDPNVIRSAQKVRTTNFTAAGQETILSAVTNNGLSISFTIRTVN